MATVDTSVEVCPAMLCAGQRWPFTVVHVLDEQLGITDGLVQCDCCNGYYLIELTCWPAASPQVRTMRLLVLQREAAERFLTNVSKDYCDLQRRQLELQALQVGAQLSPWQLTLDVTNHQLLHADELADGTKVRMVSWRERENSQ